MKITEEIEQAWNKCERADCLLWFASRAELCDGKMLVLVACECAERALKHVPDGEGKPAEAIKTAHLWVEGKATFGELADSFEAVIDVLGNVEAWISIDLTNVGYSILERINPDAYYARDEALAKAEGYDTEVDSDEPYEAFNASTFDFDGWGCSVGIPFLIGCSLKVADDLVGRIIDIRVRYLIELRDMANIVKNRIKLNELEQMQAIVKKAANRVKYEIT